MIQNPDIPSLLEQYMEISGSQNCWITVRELRSHYSLDDSAGPAIAGFLQKIYQGPFFSCRYKVVRIEKFRDSAPPYRIIRRYLVQERPSTRKKAINRPQIPDNSKGTDYSFSNTSLHTRDPIHGKNTG